MTAHARPREIRPAVLAVGVLVVLVLAVVAGARMVSVHADTWEWRLKPSAAPPKIQFDDRSYLRGSVMAGLAPGSTLSGLTSGGGAIYATAPIPGSALTVIQVLADGQVTGYALSGGP